jgi:2-methylisocitrate lyase-like PEP mutase family enzyme
MTAFETFYQLHRQEEPLLIGNIWDLTSARIF